MSREEQGRENPLPTTAWKFKKIDEYIDTDSSHTHTHTHTRTRSHTHTSDGLDNLRQLAQHQRVMMISDAAEMDKSTVLTHLSKQIKQNFQSK
jgi:hypothetical protein